MPGLFRFCSKEIATAFGFHFFAKAFSGLFIFTIKALAILTLFALLGWKYVTHDLSID
ncbi:hypothetical protein HGB07_08040 [Candidatus Roizmanbacteria bacterium]|nr:hypothetical protein [Candidatus Roizmanbacteria bacterium]